MNPLKGFLLSCFATWLLSGAAFTQTGESVKPPTPDADGVYEVSIKNLKVLDSSPKVEFPRELASSELTETIVIAVTISPEGTVKKTKVIGGRSERLKQAAEKTVKKWAFQPFLVNGTPVPVRTEISLSFENTLDHYREPNGEAPVHLDEKDSHALIVKSVPPIYPPDARVALIQGSVLLRAIIGEDGTVHALHIMTGHPMLAPAAYNAVRQWKFKPYSENGKAVPVDTNVTVNFTLQ